MAKKPGVLLLNLGSPASTDVGDVRTYLREFLMDGRVLDAPETRPMDRRQRVHPPVPPEKFGGGLPQGVDG